MDVNNILIDKVLPQLNKINKNCLLFIDRAGSGKTNLLCELALKYSKFQPAVFLSGRMTINGEYDIERHIQTTLGYQIDNLSFQHCLEMINEIVKEKNTYFLVFIDGINENRNVGLLNTALENLLTKYRDKRFKFIISCRDIYWNFFDYDFWDEFIFDKIQNLYTFTKNEFDKACKVYFQYFNIKGRLVNKAEEKCKHPLLLRFYCEAYGDPEGKLTNIGIVTELRLKELFDVYWKKKLEEIRKNPVFRAKKAFYSFATVENFIFKIAREMRERKSRTLSLNQIKLATGEKDFNQEDSIYLKILDEDLILEEEPIESSLTFERNVTFTYDEFMEYVMAKEIMRNIISEGKSKEKIKDEINKICSLLDSFISAIGILEYLGFMIKEKLNYSIWNELLGKGEDLQLLVVRSVSKLEISKLDPEIFNILLELSKKIYPQAADKLLEFLIHVEKINPQKILEILKVLIYNKNYDIRKKTLVTLINISNKNITQDIIQDVIQEILQEKDWAIQRIAIKFLWEKVNETSIPFIVAKMINSKDLKIKKLGASLLLSINHFEALEPLLVLKNKELDWARRNAMFSIERMKKQKINSLNK